VNLIAPGTEIKDNAILLPMASNPKHSLLQGNNYYFSSGARPLSKVSKRNVKNYLKIDPETLNPITEKTENLEPTQTVKEVLDEKKDKDLSIDFVTSSAISRVNIKFLLIYIPIFWLSGMLDAIIFYVYSFYTINGILFVFFLPVMIFILWFIFIVGCLFLSKLFLTLINLIHKPKEGVFKAEKGNHDFEFWCLRTELKKIVLWLVRNWPLPWMDILVFKWFDINMSLSCALYDSWCDTEFIHFGRKVLIGQGATIMSSMVIGKYLIIKKVIFDDYVMVGGHTTIVPGTIIGKETMVGAITTTTTDQVLEPGWIYTGIPDLKFKPNKYAASRREILMRKDVDDAKKYEIEHEVNIDEDKKDLIKSEEET
ncbi:MAG: hypothetical protein R3255_06355, partial [Candidatus Lokiarchaeia archaeon]|nr:hypothetical protein [Candidatus Lokiarchaeia archaeon]